MNTSTPPPAPQLAIALAFVAALTGSDKTPMRLSFIDQHKHAPLPAKEVEGSIEELWPEIMERQAEGYGVFYFLNSIKRGTGTGRGGAATNNDVAAIRALAIDRDNGRFEAWECGAGTKPKIIVHSQRGDQAIWPVVGVSISDFKNAQKRLAAHFKTDSSVCDPKRLLRLPGCFHLKGAPFLVTFDLVSDYNPANDPLAGVSELAPTKPASASKGEPVSLDHLCTAILPLIDPGCSRDQWIRCVAAIRNSPVAPAVDDNEAKRREIAHDFSAGKFWKGNPPSNYLGVDDVDLVWETMPPKEGGAGYGSLYEFAREAASAAGRVPPPANPQRTIREAFAEKDWPGDPQDVFEEDDEAPIEFPDDALPPMLAAFCRDEACRKGVTVGAIALPALVAASAALHTGIQIQFTDDPQRLQRPILWGLLVGDPGTRKTPALSAAVAPLYAIQDKWLGEDKVLFARYAREQAEYDAAAARPRANVASLGAEPGNDPAVNGSMLPVEPQEPPRRRLIASDFTTEALGYVLGKNPGRAVLVYSDELTAVIGNFDAYRSNKGRDQAHFLSLWDGNDRPEIIDRVGKKDGPLVVKNWWASVLGGIQPNRLKQQSRQLSDDGLLQRFLVVLMGAPEVGEERATTKEAGAYAVMLRRLAELAPPSIPIKMSPEARKEWLGFKQYMRDELTLNRGNAPDAYVAHLDKMENHFARLVLVMHAIECTDRDPLGQSLILPDIVSAETARRARRLLTDFFIPNSERFYRAIFGSTRLWGHVQRIASFILTHCDGKAAITPIDIYRHHKDYRPGQGGAQELQDAMHALEAYGWVSAEATAPGRGAVRWRINPGVRTKFAARTEAERQRKAAMVGEIGMASERRRRARTTG